MKTLKMLFLALCLFTTSLVFSFSSFAAEEKNLYCDAELAEISQEIVDDLADFRNAQYYIKNPEELSALSKTQECSFSKKVLLNSMERSEVLAEFEESMDVTFQEVFTSFGVLSYELNQQDLCIHAYEWVTIYYICNGYDELEEMGYGVYHDIVADISSLASPLLKTDDYSEPTGISSPDYQAPCIEESEEGGINDASTSPRAMTSVFPGYNPTAAVIYADQYCGNSTPGTSNSGNNISGYNYPAYAYILNNDCANFVSQCLYAGGVSTNSTWNTYTYAWVNARGLHTYWSASITSQLITNYNAVPGNPVYWLNAVGAKPSGHMMICVGYNASGVALVDGHNNDMYRFPINNSAFSGHTLYTLTFCTCTHSWIPKGNKYMCQNCGLIVNNLPY